MTYLFWCYPKCSTCRKVKKWLDEHQISYQERDIVATPPTVAEIKIYLSKSGKTLSSFYNTSGTIYRDLKLKERKNNLSEEEQLLLLSQYGLLIKRPLLVGDTFCLIGFDESEWQAHLG